LDIEAIMLAVLLLALNLVEFTGPDHQQIVINADAVVSVREPRDTETHFHQKIECLIATNDGKFVGVIESCDVVRERLGTLQIPD
jgi:hypothetical protein